MKNKKTIKIGPREKEILYEIGVGALVISSIIAPGLPLAVKNLSKDITNIKRIILKLKAKGLINLGGEKIKLSSKGLKMRADLERDHKLSQIDISEEGEWDGWWHLVSYDISNIYRKSRDSLRSHLERLGFKRIQESLWVFPYECQEQIALLANEISVSNNIVYMSTEKLPHEDDLKAYFGLEAD